jgi:nucleoside-diphosphate-sugar epimerase
MKILVVGGTGMIGGHAACYLQAQGNEVAIAARNAPAPETPMAKMQTLRGDYTKGDFSRDDLAPFDAIVFAAGHDIRHIPQGADADRYWEQVNSEAIPRFVELARAAGVRKVVYVGSFYPQVAPALIDTVPYVRSRHEADQRVRALATKDFSVCSVNAPFVVGTVPGLSIPMFEAYVAYARGYIEGIPAFGPAGGSNFISTQSLSEAIWSALQHGESGKAYLVGDENLSFAQYFQYFFDAVGSDAKVPSLDQEHPLLPDMAIFTGRGSTVSYEPDAQEQALLGYRRHDIRRAIEEVVAQYSAG